MKRFDFYKMRIAIAIQEFVRKWSIKKYQFNTRIDPTVWISFGTTVYPNVPIGRYTYVSYNSTIASGSIGSFCSIANNVLIGFDEHPLKSVSTHPFWYDWNGFNLRADDNNKYWSQMRNPPQIGNDVWIGAGVIILRGAIIDDGAVIGAGSVVTGHIPSYAIAVGTPAKVTRFRFSPEIRDALQRTQWWNWDREKLIRHRRFFASPEEFLDLVFKNLDKEEL